MNRLLLIDDEADVQYSFRRIFRDSGLELATASSGEEGLRLIPKFQPDLVIMDVRMAGMSGLETLRRLRQTDARLPVIMMTAYGTTQTAIEAMKLGAYDYLLKPFDVVKLKDLVAGALRAAQAMRQTVVFEGELAGEDLSVGMVGRSEAMQAVFKLIGQLAVSDATVLITGESGTGKELAARAIYSHSRRARQPFLAINCAAIPETLLESELFGHEKGAFTGAAVQRIGKFEQSHGGTLFLDEIGDMSLATQTKILRVLQAGEFERVGGNQTVKVNVRVIAATNRPLEKAVRDKHFREDLFYRLNVVRLHLPPLRERRGDLPWLVQYFLQKFAHAAGQPVRGVAPDTLALLERHPWPGNVRELENVIQRALVVCKGDALLPADLPDELRAAAGAVEGAPEKAEAVAAPVAPAASAAPVAAADASAGVAGLAQSLFAWARQDRRRRVLPAVERELVIQALRETGGNQAQAAALLGITRATLRKRIERFGIRRQVSVE